MMVSYDDGEYEWIDCSKEKYELMALSPIPRAPAASQVSTSQMPSASLHSQMSVQQTQISQKPMPCKQANSAFCRVQRRSRVYSDGIRRTK